MLRWRSSAPMLGPPTGFVSIKDPTAIHHAGAWHVFATLRAPHRIEHLTFDAFPPERVERNILELGTEMAAAPQVFLHSPSERFFLIFQAKGAFPYGPAYSTNESLDPRGWSPARPIPLEEASRARLDFWTIGDGARMFLFYSSLDGKVWRAQTGTESFPLGFSRPVLAFEGDLFEAAHIFAAADRFLMVAEAKRFHRRHQRWLAALSLDGPWTPLGSFASKEQIENGWCDSISHGELLRSGIDEHMTIDPERPRFLHQGATDLETLRPYASIPWRLALLESEDPLTAVVI